MLFRARLSSYNPFKITNAHYSIRCCIRPARPGTLTVFKHTTKEK